MDNGPTTEQLIDACIREHNWEGAYRLIADHAAWQTSEIDRLRTRVEEARKNPAGKRRIRVIMPRFDGESLEEYGARYQKALEYEFFFHYDDYDYE